ncbi:MAG: hypothetical protein D6736_15225 [Nitrospinota bacterium]|nr:MAG: hypothetical protein D6736_15225 [Nitrospinota bacterium]
MHREDSGQPKRCRCGYDINHPWVVPKAKDSVWGWMLLLLGASVLPKAVAMQCDRCGKIFDWIDDLDTRRKYSYSGG